MFNSERYIVAIDLGSYKIALSVAKVEGEDVQVVYYKETPSSGIRYSSVFNVMQATAPLEAAIKEAEEALDIKITQAVVGMSRYPIRQVTGKGMLDKSDDDFITAEDVEFMKSCAENSYPLQDKDREAIYGAVAQSFSDGENFQIIESEIIGMTGNQLEGNFKIFIGKRSDIDKIDKVLSMTGIAAARKYFTADSTAKAVLTDAEMENGVALVDFGAGCVSVSIYQGSIMRHYASIPFGGKSITDDIRCECQIQESLAENIKMAFGACMPDKLQNLGDKVIHIRSNSTEPDKQLPVKYLSEIITARVEEIIMAVLYEIEASGFADMLRSGLVISGGCAQTANLNNFINDISGFSVRTGYPKASFSCMGCDGISETTAATSIGLIMAAKDDMGINCAYNRSDAPQTSTEEPAEKEEEVRDTLFDPDDIETVERRKTPKRHRGVTFTSVQEKVSGFFDNIFENISDDNE